ncbi:MAG: hypothetical protein QS99_C0013G0050 [archaeon GW2011_AR4]|nr:MAG: hypothetical protein QS99_C0013G0050 [archaeon GW2011_AR4]
MGVFLVYAGILDPLLLFMILIAGILVHIVQKMHPLPLITPLLSLFEREEHRFSFPGKGAIFFVAGFLLALKLFPLNIALAGVMIVTLGDAASHIVGMALGRTKNPLNRQGFKLVEGTLAGIFAGFLGASLFVSPLHALLGAIAGMIAEAMDIDLNRERVDDNIIVPLVAGTVILGLQNQWLLKVWHFLLSFWVV